MIHVKKIEDVYPAIEELIKVLAQKNEQKISDLLHHRMYKVSWSSSSELFEELQGVLKGFLQKEGRNLDKRIADQIEDILKAIEEDL